MFVWMLYRCYDGNGRNLHKNLLATRPDLPQAGYPSVGCPDQKEKSVPAGTLLKDKH